MSLRTPTALISPLPVSATKYRFAPCSPCELPFYPPCPTHKHPASLARTLFAAAPPLHLTLHEMCPMQTNPCTAQRREASEGARMEQQAGLGMGQRKSLSTQQQCLAAREGSRRHCLTVGMLNWHFAAACTTQCMGCCKQRLLVFTCSVGWAAAAASTAALLLRHTGVGRWGAPYNTLAALGLLLCRSTVCGF